MARLNVRAWRSIDTNSTVLSWIEDGIQIPFVEQPKTFEIDNYRFTQSEVIFVRSEIERLVSAGFLTKCPAKPKFISPLGCVPKKDNKLRLITDFRELNNYCARAGYKQEDIRNVAEIIRPNDYMTTIDLKDGFYHIPVHRDFQEYLSIIFEGNYYSYTVLSFGFCLSPYFFQKALRPVVTYLRTLDIRLSLYVDDFIICADRAQITDHTDTVTDTLEDLGLHINHEKSVLKATQIVDYLGYTVNTTGSYPVIRAQKTRIKRIKREIRKLLTKKCATAKAIAKVCGLCVSVAWAVSPAKLFLLEVGHTRGKKS